MTARARLATVVLAGAAALVPTTTGCPSLDGLVASGDASSDASPSCDDAAPPEGDRHNCGACGHDCLGGECQAGRCQPFVLVAASVDTNFYMQFGDPLLFADDKRLYWCSPAIITANQTEEPMAWSADKVSGVTTAESLPTTLGVWTALYAQWLIVASWSSPNPPLDQYTFWTMSTALDTGATTLLSPKLVGLRTVTVAGDHLTWGDSASIWQCSMPTCADSQLLANAPDIFDFLVADANGIFFDDKYDVFMCPWASGTPGDAGQPSCSPLVVGVLPAYPQMAVQDATALYFVFPSLSTAAAKILRVLKAGGESIVADNVNNPTGLVSDGVNLYWIEPLNQGALRSMPVGGGVPVTLTVGQSTPGGNIVVDDQALYWVNGTNLMKLAK